MHKALATCICPLIFAVTACGAPKIGYDYDHTANFRGYRTFEWGPEQQQVSGDARIDNTLLDTRIRTAVADELRAKGFSIPINGEPDFYVAYHAGLKDMMKGASTQNYIGDMSHGTYTTINDIQAYKEGTLLIDIVDAGSKQLVWQGSALAEVSPGMTPEERDKRIHYIIHGMLEHFPPKK
ncbi:hypothetical protein W02_01070 [Nitrospira sp. KM1]|uniref:DUF4136 domain-containing protein n=1 Tax=Nitrospira sp. KM1 TaxID=1936990 RepID=UPI0013A7AD14|nr:DUF4136 domain-containing protein [Nitrospira sp. KM1]BCA52967.1 hypothetical protein W02_01070 [Nitrospira sp. KM1]